VFDVPVEPVLVVPVEPVFDVPLAPPALVLFVSNGEDPLSGPTNGLAGNEALFG
jgi:hypothetical protein